MSHNGQVPVLRSREAAAFITGRHPDLIRRWCRSGQLTTACDLATRTVLVDISQIAALSRQRQTRRAAA